MSTKVISVPPGGHVMVKGMTRASSIACQRVTVLADDSINSGLPGGLVLAPSLHKLEAGFSTQRIDLELKNLSIKAIIIPQKTHLSDIFQVETVYSKHQNVTIAQISENILEQKEDLSDANILIDKFEAQLKENLSAEQVADVNSLLCKWQSIFALHDLDLGKTSKVKHHIRLTDETPFKEKYRNIPPALVNEVRQHLQEMLDLGVIRRSESPYTPNVVLVRKKDEA